MVRLCWLMVMSRRLICVLYSSIWTICLLMVISNSTLLGQAWDLIYLSSCSILEISIEFFFASSSFSSFRLVLSLSSYSTYIACPHFEDPTNSSVSLIIVSSSSRTLDVIISNFRSEPITQTDSINLMDSKVATYSVTVRSHSSMKEMSSRQSM